MKLAEAFVELNVRGMQRVQSMLQRLKSRTMMLLGAAGAGAAVYGFTRLLKSSVQSAAEAEHADLMLANMLKLVKSASASGAAMLGKYAEELQNVTGYSDEVIKHAMTQLATFQLNEKQIKALTPRILDMAAALEQAGKTEVDLHQISIAVGKAIAMNMYGTLRRYGVVMTDAEMKSKDFNTMLKVLDKNYKDSAKTLGISYIGSIRRMRNAIDELKERIGFALLPKFKEWTRAAISWVQSGQAEKFADRIALIAKEAARAAEALYKMGKFFGLFPTPMPKGVPAEKFTWAARKERARTEITEFEARQRKLWYGGPKQKLEYENLEKAIGLRQQQLRKMFAAEIIQKGIAAQQVWRPGRWEAAGPGMARWKPGEWATRETVPILEDIERHLKNIEQRMPRGGLAEAGALAE